MGADRQDPAPEALPAAPGAGGRLRAVVDGVVGADGEDVQVAVGIEDGADRQEFALFKDLESRSGPPLGQSPLTTTAGTE
jgi:hypothetical protein